MNTDKPNRPDYVRPEVADAVPDLRLVRDLLGGTRAMQASEAIAEYIPPWPDETPTTWRKRTRAAGLYEGIGRVLSASVGKLFATAPVLTYPTREEELTRHWDNIDGMGNKGNVAVKGFTDQSIADGVGVIFVDHPNPPEGAVVTRRNQGDLGLRPLWAFYDRAAILSWRTAVINHETHVTQMVLREATAVATGEFGIAHEVFYRVLWVRNGIAGWTLYRHPEDKLGLAETFPVEAEGIFRDVRGNTRPTLPIAIAQTGPRHGPVMARPPLMGVAHANLDHWRDKTELRWGSRIAGIEQLVVKGTLLGKDGKAGELKIGWEHAINVAADGDVKYEGPSGRGLAELAKRMHEAEQEMASLGMSFLSRDTRAAETAEAKRLDATAENASLATAAQAIEDAVNLAWEHHGWYLGLAKAECPTVAINRDFERVTMDAAMIGAVGALVKEGFPVRTAVQMLAAGGVIPTTDVAELDLLALEWESGQAAAQDARAMELEARRGAAVPDDGMREAA